MYEGARQHPDKASRFAPVLSLYTACGSIKTDTWQAAVCMLFLFNLAYAATWGTVAFLVPTEIFPSDLRAQGNGFGITGWAIGVGMTTLVNPIMFATLQVSFEIVSPSSVSRVFC